MAERDPRVPPQSGDRPAEQPRMPSGPATSGAGADDTPDRHRRGLIHASLCGGLAALDGTAPARAAAAPNVQAGDLPPVRTACMSGR
jgi:hypothetical protein